METPWYLWRDQLEQESRWHQEHLAGPGTSQKRARGAELHDAEFKKRGNSCRLSICSFEATHFANSMRSVPATDSWCTCKWPLTQSVTKSRPGSKGGIARSRLIFLAWPRACSADAIIVWNYSRNFVRFAPRNSGKSIFKLSSSLSTWFCTWMNLPNVARYGREMSNVHQCHPRAVKRLWMVFWFFFISDSVINVAI